MRKENLFKKPTRKDNLIKKPLIISETIIYFILYLFIVLKIFF